jgi:hypothetical protein
MLLFVNTLDKTKLYIQQSEFYKLFEGGHGTRDPALDRPRFLVLLAILKQTFNLNLYFVIMSTSSSTIA